ncbi:MAG: LysM peptidoglycan-binding domain-containing protein [Sphingobacteriaceae bacterium]
MYLRTLVFISGLLFSAPSMASSVDSVGVEMLEGKQIILHKVTAKETYYSLGRTYGVNPASIIDFNKNKPLSIGDLVKIPTQRPYVAPKTNIVIPAPQAQPQGYWLRHKVKPKETLFSIAKKFETSVDELKSINKLNANGLKIGQSLKVKWISVGPAAAPIAEASQPVAINTSEPEPAAETTINDVDRKLPPARYGLREVKEKGVATWIQDENMDEGKMLALHPTAPIGTIIKITNPMTQKSTFAKVVGKFTENESTRGAIIIITKTAADLIGALDKRFQVNLVYGIPDEQ